MSRTTSPRKVKATFTLDADLLDKCRKAVEEGMAPSQASLIADGLRLRLRELREEQIERELELAANDPLFLADIEAVQRDFEYADAETAAMIPDYD